MYLRLVGCNMLRSNENSSVCQRLTWQHSPNNRVQFILYHLFLFFLSSAWSFDLLVALISLMLYLHLFDVFDEGRVCFTGCYDFLKRITHKLICFDVQSCSSSVIKCFCESWCVSARARGCVIVWACEFASACVVTWVRVWVINWYVLMLNQ